MSSPETPSYDPTATTVEGTDPVGPVSEADDRRASLTELYPGSSIDDWSDESLLEFCKQHSVDIMARARRLEEGKTLDPETWSQERVDEARARRDAISRWRHPFEWRYANSQLKSAHIIPEVR